MSKRSQSPRVFLGQPLRAWTHSPQSGESSSSFVASSFHRHQSRCAFRFLAKRGGVRTIRLLPLCCHTRAVPSRFSIPIPASSLFTFGLIQALASFPVPFCRGFYSRSDLISSTVSLGTNDVKRIHPQGRGRRPSQSPVIAQGEDALFSFLLCSRILNCAPADPAFLFSCSRG